MFASVSRQNAQQRPGCHPSRGNATVRANRQPVGPPLVAFFPDRPQHCPSRKNSNHFAGAFTPTKRAQGFRGNHGGCARIARTSRPPSTEESALQAIQFTSRKREVQHSNAKRAACRICIQLSRGVRFPPTHPPLRRAFGLNTHKIAHQRGVSTPFRAKTRISNSRASARFAHSVIQVVIERRKSNGSAEKHRIDRRIIGFDRLREFSAKPIENHAIHNRSPPFRPHRPRQARAGGARPTACDHATR